MTNEERIAEVESEMQLEGMENEAYELWNSMTPQEQEQAMSESYDENMQGDTPWNH